jgi:hypothetical protein
VITTWPSMAGIIHRRERARNLPEDTQGGHSPREDLYRHLGCPTRHDRPAGRSGGPELPAARLNPDQTSSPSSESSSESSSP